MANKNTLIERLVDNVGLSKKQATKAVDEVLVGVKNSLEAGETLRIIDFGTFSVHERAERKGRNPKDGSEIKIPATKVPKFKASKAFKNSVKDVK